MACLKVFSGDLPELTNEIIKYFHDDYITLHSCILINRLWCRLAIPLLWENPFSIQFPKNYHFIEIYLHNLNDNDKTKLNEYGINNDLIPSNTLFNYSSFIQHLDTSNIISSIESWGAAVRTSKTQISKFIYRSLFQIFIENEVNLHSLEVVSSSSQESKYFDDIFKLNPNFFRNIKILNLEDSFITVETLTKFSTLLNSNCNSISSLYFKFPLCYNDNNGHSTIEKSLSQIINSQENLRKILLGFSRFSLYHTLLSLKSSNCSNTLNTIIFYYVDFKNIIDTKFIPQIINITKPFKLKSLILNEILQIESLLLLIQKFVIIYCSKIKILYLPSGLNSQNINSLINLIENIKQNLNYLLIDTNDNHLSSIILQNLGQILPFKLEYLYLSLITNRSDLEAFLKNSRNTFIKILVIKNTTKYESEDIFPYIEEYIIKKKRIKYLAILQTFLTSFLTAPRKNLFDLKDKVDYYKLYDIQVLDCYSSSINIEKFIL
ncbi:hypothetical protein RhiirB3_437418 [Rhizophagus irregularis]|nr:hypothetical protein RhiirB3_437418 [Rhizophagus irregularis]